MQYLDSFDNYANFQEYFLYSIIHFVCRDYCMYSQPAYPVAIHVCMCFYISLHTSSYSVLKHAQHAETIQ